MFEEVCQCHGTIPCVSEFSANKIDDPEICGLNKGISIIPDNFFLADIKIFLNNKVVFN